MRREHGVGLRPSLVVGAGIVISTLVAVRTADAGSLALTGPLLLALAVAGADMLESWSRGNSSGPSAAALFLGGAILLAGSLVTFRDPNLVKTLLPVMGAPAWIILVRRPGQRKTCKVI